MVAASRADRSIRDARPRHGRLDFPRLSSPAGGLLRLEVSRGRSWWFASSVEQTRLFDDARRRRRDRLLVTAAIRAAEREYLGALFDAVISGPRTSFMPFADIKSVATSERPQDLAIGALADAEREVVVLVRGDLERVIVPFGWFAPAADGTVPDFTDIAVIDGGLTLRLGRYEAAVEAILYEFDAGFRARERARRLIVDESFGAALRRLRIQKGVARSDFPGLTERTIARIERNEVARPHGTTLRTIADRLGVEPDEIGTF